MNKLITISAGLVLALLIGLTLTWPKFQGLRVIQQKVDAKYEELQSKENYFQKVGQVYSQLQDHTEALEKIASALPQTPALPSLFNFLQSSASQTGLLMDEIELIDMTKGEIKVGCKVLGEYPDFKNFLKAVEDSARLVEVEEVSFEVSEDLGEPIEFSVNIKAQSY